MGGGAADAEAAHVDVARAGGDVVDHVAGEDDAGVGARLSGRVFDVLPGEAGAAGHDVVVEEDERFGRIDAEALEVGGGAVGVDVIDADEPGVFSVGDGEAAAAALVAGMRAGHVVGDGAEVAGLGEVEGALLFGDDVAADEEAAVFHAVDGLGHLGFAAAGCAFVHEDELVFVGGDDGDGGAVVGGPAFALADVEEHGVDAFFRAGAGVEVVGEDFLMGLGAVVDDDLACRRNGCGGRAGRRRGRRR